MHAYKIEIENLTKIYRQYSSTWQKILEQFNINSKEAKEFCVLRDLNLKVRDGERLGIIGRNGAGKSTLLKMISGLLQPTAGVIKIHGTVNALFDTSTGFHPEFTGRQNVISNLGFRGIAGKQALRILDDVIEFSELYDFIDQPFKTYSSGMQSRLTFSVATIIKPDILIIDEILGAGDAYFATKCLDRMTQLTSTGATVLFVSHSLGAVLQLCDRVIWIDRGQILADGAPMEVVTEYQKSVDAYERLRLIAKNNRLHVKLTPAVLGGTHGKYMICKINVPASQGTAFVHKITLMNNGQEEQQLAVGGALDMSAEYGMFLTDTPNTWSKPTTFLGKACRSVCPSATPACFFTLFPYVTAATDNYSLTVSITGKAPCPVQISTLDSQGQETVLYKDEVSDSWSELTIAIPSSVYEDAEIALPQGTGTAHTPQAPAADTTEEISDANLPDTLAALEEDDEGPVYLSSFELLCNDSPSTVFKAGDKFEGVLRYICLEDMPMPIFAITISRADGIRMRQAISSQKTDGLPEPTLHKGSGEISFKIDPLLFGPGNYYMTVAAFREVDLTNTMISSKPIFMRSNAYEFMVSRPYEVLVDMGCIECAVTWKKSNPTSANI